MRTAITHTVNVVQRERGTFGAYFGSEDTVVAKYVIKVSLHMSAGGSGSEEGMPGRGDAPRIEWQVARRYSHFRACHFALDGMFPHVTLPKLPPKRYSTHVTDPETVAERMVALDGYLRQVLQIPAVAACTQMLTFLGAYQGMQVCT